jgi:FkbM family methyltransferase
VQWYANRLHNRDATIQTGLGKGLRFNPGSANASYVLGTAEPIMQRCFTLLQSGMVVYDIGANVGFFTVLAARLVGPYGKVVAFEPVSANTDLVRHNAQLNGFRQVLVRNEALGGADCKALFQISRYDTLGKLEGVGGDAFEKTGEIEVSLRRLDGLAHDGALPPPDLMKIDVEGAEAELLDGASEVIAKSRPILLIELHGTHQAVGERLRNFGYQSIMLDSAHLIAMSTARQDLVAKFAIPEGAIWKKVSKKVSP